MAQSNHLSCFLRTRRSFGSGHDAEPHRGADSDGQDFRGPGDERAPERSTGTRLVSPNRPTRFVSVCGTDARPGPSAGQSDAQWISAVVISGMALVAGLGTGVVVAVACPGWATVIALLNGALNLSEGSAVRATRASTPWGALLDSIMARVADAAPLIGLAVFHADRIWTMLLPLVALVSGFSISYVRSRVRNLGTKLPELSMRHAPRALLLLSTLVLGVSASSMGISVPCMLVGIGILALVNTVGAIGALVAARRVLSSPRSSPTVLAGATVSQL